MDHYKDLWSAIAVTLINFLFNEIQLHLNQLKDSAVLSQSLLSFHI
jgi:hypothetical protein